MSKKTHIGAGNVEIELDDEICVLKPSLQACQALSRMRGGINNTVRAVGDLDFDVMVTVIGLGLGLSGKELKELPERVYENGLPELSGPLIRYLSNVANGGKPFNDDGGSDKDQGNAESR
jgi:hypothetical protein